MIEVLRSLLLDFSSGSSINFYNDRLYLIGDDATRILILDREYNFLQGIPVFEYKETRIPKSIKPDFETSSIIRYDGKDHLLILGSASRDNRMEGILLPLNPFPFSAHEHTWTALHLADFIARVKEKNIGEINLEGSTVIGNHFVLSNRANETNPINTLISTTTGFWNEQHTASITTSSLILLDDLQGAAGVSELCYVAEKDLLLITLSSEQTSNAYDDGEIGDSFIGWVNSVSTKITQPEIKIDGAINLSKSDPLFTKQKIEGICVESVNNEELLLHLIADNDDGKSRLFKLKVNISSL